MTAHLLVIAIGPVQDFISAARRTRDLWFGSFLLSEISKAAARAIYHTEANLIFPAPHNTTDLEPGSQHNVANLIVAELPDDAQPEQVKNTAENAARQCWCTFADTVKAVDVAGEIIDLHVWHSQVEDIIEFYAAWVPLPTHPKAYREARQQVMRLLAGRKACRDFLPARGFSKLPKSSLDGARESVLVHRDRRQRVLTKKKKLAQRLRLRRGEELDVVGLVKRAATKESFVSVVRVAADPWIRGIVSDGGKARETLQAIAQECTKLMDYEGEDTVHVTGTGDRFQKSLFPYDGAILYPTRLDSLLRPRESDEEVDILTLEDKEVLRSIRSLLKILQQQENLGYGEPDPYLAILVADGDHMGKAISTIELADEHRKFSQQLAHFAGMARGIVERHHGCLIYSGGDDVLAFLPVDHGLSCARELHCTFEKELHCTFEKLLKRGECIKPTLSVGLAIGHCLEPLEDLLNYARAAEKQAKQPNRNGLAVHLHARSGPPIRVRAQWTDNIDKRLEHWAYMHSHDLISDKAAYDLRILAKDYAGWPDSATTDRIIKKDIERLLIRKKGIGETLDWKLLEENLERCFNNAETAKPAGAGQIHQDYHNGVMQLANEWLIARRIAKTRRQADGKNRRLSEETEP